MQGQGVMLSGSLRTVALTFSLSKISDLWHWSNIVFECVGGLTGVRLLVNILGLSSSEARALAQYARGPGLESWLRLDLSPPVYMSC